MPSPLPLEEAVQRGPVVLDGGLGTLLEARGNDLSGGVWSARLLRDRPEEIVAAHREFFDAGARVAIAASYQASFEGFAREGVERREAEALLRRAVALADEARAEREAWVAASVGPYGAMLADGSEYRGNYGLTVDELRAWHRPRLEILADAGADLLAVETVPSLAEVEAVTAEVDRLGVPAWISVTVSLGTLRSGESLAEAFGVAASSPAVVAVGVNCSAPSEVLGSIAVARQATRKAIVVYPNSGEEWDAKNRTWVGSPAFPDELIRRWRHAGATLIGGCCRVRPEQIAHLAEVLEEAA
ncbi:homocysteine S-methyltransferase [Naasia sp. SYSU D00057]|uniref:homocysteine S-methyltransferase n=1 Tax=Naasia sp. SYSU D00057 TaxID=2817380 RepID=UPI001B3082C5|nr:homocysteine S-methyltransferase [Naasia sp. SYSU D00057]